METRVETSNNEKSAWILKEQVLLAEPHCIHWGRVSMDNVARVNHLDFQRTLNKMPIGIMSACQFRRNTREWINSWLQAKYRKQKIKVNVNCLEW